MSPSLGNWGIHSMCKFWARRIDLFRKGVGKVAGDIDGSACIKSDTGNHDGPPIFSPVRGSNMGFL